MTDGLDIEYADFVRKYGFPGHGTHRPERADG